MTDGWLRYRIAKTPLRSAVVWWRHLGVDPQDTYLGAYPRSGSTWLKFMLFELLSGEEADFVNDQIAVPHVGGQRGARRLLAGEQKLIKTHEHFRPQYRKAVYLVRDVRDVVLAEYAFNQWRGVEERPFDDFLERFLAGRIHGYSFGSWITHVGSWLRATESDSKIKILKFEDLTRDTVGTMQGVLRFLDAVIDADELQRVVDNNSVARMREREDRARDRAFGNRKKAYAKGHRFVRKGRSGGWRTSLTRDQIARVHEVAGDLLCSLGYPLQ